MSVPAWLWSDIHTYIHTYVQDHSSEGQMSERVQASTSSKSDGSPDHEATSSAFQAFRLTDSGLQSQSSGLQTQGSCNSHADAATLCELRSQVGRLSQVNKGLQQEVEALTNSKRALYCLWKVPSMDRVSHNAPITPHHTLHESLPCHVTCKTNIVYLCW